MPVCCRNSVARVLKLLPKRLFLASTSYHDSSIRKSWARKLLKSLQEFSVRKKAPADKAF